MSSLLVLGFGLWVIYQFFEVIVEWIRGDREFIGFTREGVIPLAAFVGLIALIVWFVRWFMSWQI